MHPRILAISGSRRHDSLNRRLQAAAAESLRDAGAEITILDWDRFSLPLFDGDLEIECGPPPDAVWLKKLIASHDGLIIATPEYNGSITPLLKNAIDWTSRPGGPEAVFRDRPVALLAASPGGLGGKRGLVHLREVLANLGAWVLPGQYALGNADTAFDPRSAKLLGEHDRPVTAVTDDLLSATHRPEDASVETQRRA